jgi:hypothetical protein
LKSFILTEGHHLILRRDGSTISVPARNATTLDALISLDGTPRQILTVNRVILPQSDFVQIYTSTSTLILNNEILGSCKSENDGSDYFLAPLTFLGHYFDLSLPQKLANLYQALNLNALVKPALSYFL